MLLLLRHSSGFAKRSKFENNDFSMADSNIKEEVMEIARSLSLEEVNDIFYKIILEKKLKQSEDDVKNGKLFTTKQVKEKLKV